MKIKISNSNVPAWKDVTVKSRIPAELKKLEEMARNIWWAWNNEATDLFKDLDPVLWKEAGQNPVVLLERLSYEKLEAIAADKNILKRMNDVYAKFRAYMDVKPDANRPSVAYFCMEYGLTHVLKIYSGGLGILAGDYMKEASDSNVDMCGVGFLYRYGYFAQSLAMDGQQIANYDAQNFGSLPIDRVMDENGQPMVIDVPYLNYYVHAYVWRVNVGRVPLYLLDTDNEMNSEFDRPITHQLYGGDWENRLKQEILLGIGGMLMLKKLGIKKDVYHCNEGHAALCNVQRLCDYVESGLTFNEAMEVVRSSSLYTVHTPVPAGHDYFDEGLFGRYMGEFPGKLGISWQEFIDMGRENPGSNEKFSMSVFALNTCQEANGVSWLHGKVSQRMFAPVWKGYFPDELHVGYVTNGVHMPTWASTEWKRFFAENFSEKFFKDQSNKTLWEAIQNIADEDIWAIRKTLKNKLIAYIKNQYKANWLKNQGDPAKVVSILDKINPNALMIGFGRRFATYKRAHLLFTDLDRLAKIVNNEQYPIQFVFTGKAHPADGGGQGLIKHIVEISRRPEFLGKIIFLENYDMRLARHLIAGVDVWLNTPTRPLEASGTSGEKAEMNGVLNYSVLDGWWYEGYKPGAGWALTEKRTYDNQQYQDQLDAATIYNTLENEIIPTYYAKNSKGYSPEWIQYIKNSMSQIAPDYTMKRMLDDYIERFYNKLATRSAHLAENNYATAKSIAAWKEEVAEHWDNFQVESFTCNKDLSIDGPVVGQENIFNIVIDRKELQGMLGVELVITSENPEKHNLELVSVEQFKLVKEEGSKLFFELKRTPSYPGLHKMGFRVYPVNSELPHRMDFAYVRWIQL